LFQDDFHPWQFGQSDAKDVSFLAVMSMEEAQNFPQEAYSVPPLAHQVVDHWYLAKTV
jgi:hypothetical protein